VCPLVHSFSGIITHCLFEFYFNRISLVKHLLRSVITIFILLSCFDRSSVSPCSLDSLLFSYNTILSLLLDRHAPVITNSPNVLISPVHGLHFFIEFTRQNPECWFARVNDLISLQNGQMLLQHVAVYQPVHVTVTVKNKWA